MLMYLITKWFGVFLCKEKKIFDYILFPNEEKEILKRLKKIDSREILQEEKKLTKGKNVIVFEKRLEKVGDLDQGDYFFKEIDIKPSDYDFSKELFQKISVSITENKVNEKLKSEDLQIIQMVNALDDLLKISNLLNERFSCWNVISSKNEKIEKFKKTISVVDNEIKILEQQIDEDMKKFAPNTSEIVGSLIGARLISLAGGIQKLAVLPASTIQILGAEKALFRFKKEGGKPPKHGIIFQHPTINRSILKNRGKIARLLSTKISLATKADVFTKRDISKILKEEFNNQMKLIKNK